MTTLFSRYQTAKSNLRSAFRGMKKNKRKKSLEKEAAFLIHHIGKYCELDRNLDHELLEYAALEIEKLEGLVEKIG